MFPNFLFEFLFEHYLSRFFFAAFFKNDIDFESGFEPWHMDLKGKNIIPWRISDSGTPNKGTGPEKPFITSKHKIFGPTWRSYKLTHVR